MTLQRLSVYENTTPGWSFEEDVRNYQKAGIKGIGVGYDKIRDMEIEDVKKLLHDSGLQVSSLVLTGFYTQEQKKREELPFCIGDSTKAIELAHRIKAGYLLVLSGPPRMKNGGIKAAEELTRDSLRDLAPLAEELDVRLGLEILHPMYLDAWSAISTIEQAMDIVEDVDSKNVGLVLDLYHIFWDPKLSEGIKRAAGKIFGVHVNDWRFPTRDILLDRVLIGDGIIPVQKILDEINKTGYEGFFEIEIISEELSKADYSELLEKIKESYKNIYNNQAVESNLNLED
jgi:sugar phosphate isomerase/epimerase